MNKKISLFSPFNNPNSAYGLRILHNALSENGFESDVFYYVSDFRIPYTEEVLKSISYFLHESDIILISLYTNHFSNIKLLTEHLKNTGCKSQIIWGGIHAIVRPEECIKYADIVCVGEGEECVPELIERILNNEPYTDINGFWYKDGNDVIKTEPRKVTDLNTVPYATYSNDKHHIITTTGLKRIPEPDYFTTLTSRGCPFSCTYCINGFFNKNIVQKIRHRSNDNVIGELIQAVKQHPNIKTIWIDDDAFFAMSAENLRLFADMYKTKIGLPFYVSGITPTTINEEKLNILIGAGLISIRIGIQSCSEKVLELYHRKYSPNKVIGALDIATKFDLSVQLDIITDNPWENELDTINTIMVLEQCKKPFFLNIFNLVFFPGTELYDRAIAEGKITDELSQIYNMRFHSYQKTPLNCTLELLSIRAKYYLGLPYLVKHTNYDSQQFMWVIKFYTLINRLYLPYYVVRKLYTTWKVRGLSGFKRFGKELWYKIKSK